MTRLLKTSIIVAFLVAGARTSAAQPSAYVFGGLGAARQDGATTEEHRTYLEAPGGLTPLLSAGGGVRLTRAMSVEGEFRRTGRVTAVEPSRYFITYSAQRRDTIASAGARWHLLNDRVVGIEPAISVGLVREESWLASKTAFAPSEADFGEHHPFVDSWGRDISVGVDLRMGRGRAAFVPGFR